MRRIQRGSAKSVKKQTKKNLAELGVFLLKQLIMQDVFTGSRRENVESFDTQRDRWWMAEGNMTKDKPG